MLYSFGHLSLCFRTFSSSIMQTIMRKHTFRKFLGNSLCLKMITRREIGVSKRVTGKENGVPELVGEE